MIILQMLLLNTIMNFYMRSNVSDEIFYVAFYICMYILYILYIYCIYCMYIYWKIKFDLIYVTFHHQDIHACALIA